MLILTASFALSTATICSAQKTVPYSSMKGTPTNDPKAKTYMFCSRGGSMIILDHANGGKVVGYERPDSTSGKVVLLAVVTEDENDPFHIELSVTASGKSKTVHLKYQKQEGNFIKISCTATDQKPEGTSIYVNKELVIFE